MHMLPKWSVGSNFWKIDVAKNFGFDYFQFSLKGSFWRSWNWITACLHIPNKGFWILRNVDGFCIIVITPILEGNKLKCQVLAVTQDVIAREEKPTKMWIICYVVFICWIIRVCLGCSSRCVKTCWLPEDHWTHIWIWDWSKGNRIYLNIWWKR